jgi:hypothetical protein
MLFRPISESRRNRWGFACRILLVLLVAASFAVLQAEGVMEVHAHHHSGPDDHCCPVCHSAHFPILQATGTVAIGALGVSEWHPPPSADPTTSGCYLSLRSSRAPPA